MANKIYGYTVVAYPESMPTNWKILLNELPFGYCYSLHDKDVDSDGVLKKPHYHFFFQGKATPNQKKYIHGALAINYGEDIRSYAGMYDYLTHENNPDKHHYSKDRIQYSDKWNQELFECNYNATVQDSMLDIIQIIDRVHITEYSQLLNYLVVEGRQDLLSASKAYWVIKYIDSKRNSLKSIKK